MKKFFIYGIAGILIVMALSLLALNAINAHPTVSFYKVSPKDQKVLLSYVNTLQTNKTFEAQILESSVPLSSQKKLIKKSTLIFTGTDMDSLEYASEKGVVLSQELLSGYPSSIVESLNKNQPKLTALPILYDFYQVDVNRPLYDSTLIKNINTWEDFSAYSATALSLTKDQFPENIYFAGSDASSFLDIFGALSLSFVTTEQYEALIKNLYSAFKKDRTLQPSEISYPEVKKVLEAACENNGEFNSTVQELNILFQNQLASPQSLNSTDADIKAIMDRENCSSAIVKLSDHRKINHNVINNYTSIFIPSKEFTAQRKFAAPEISVICGKTHKKLGLELIRLLSCDCQTGLSTQTGLSPVQKNCSVADKQADDVRYWLAASDGPAMILSGALPARDAQQIAAEYIKGLLR